VNSAELIIVIVLTQQMLQ